MHNKPQRLFAVIISAVIFLILLSICPWQSWTGGRLKDFSLITGVKTPVAVDNDTTLSDIDPELVAMQAEIESAEKHDNSMDTAIVFSPSDIDFTVPTREGVVLIEDYSANGNGLARLSNTLSQASSRNVRIAMVGDSYIEGDILAQDIRSQLQSIYGGCGVGYVGAFSQFPGFRHSVIQTTSGWDEVEIRKMNDDPLRTILGHYHKAQTSVATTRFKATSKVPHADAWMRSRVLFIAPSSGAVSLESSDTQLASMAVSASDSLQSLTYDGKVSDLKLKSDIKGLKVLGLWLEGRNGIVLDDISLRGNSGVSHRKLNESMTRQMRRWIDYDLIILEFGMNVLSATQRNYSSYGKGLVEVINNLKRLYPNAQILVMGVGDRGTKVGSDVVSMSTIPALIKAQRDAAAATGSLFYDTREAMGGNGAALDWHNRKLVNSDYVHLNHKGGKVLGEIFVKSLNSSIK